VATSGGNARAVSPEAGSHRWFRHGHYMCFIGRPALTGNRRWHGVGAQVIPPPTRLRDRVLGRRRVAQRRWRPQFLVEVSSHRPCRMSSRRASGVAVRGGDDIGRQRSHTPRKLALLHEVLVAYAAEHQTRMQCVAELRVPRCSRRARAPTPLNSACLSQPPVPGISRGGGE
jgi:hypothetical protein